jgi:hypothetical protein
LYKGGHGIVVTPQLGGSIIIEKIIVIECFVPKVAMVVVFIPKIPVLVLMFWLNVAHFFDCVFHLLMDGLQVL